jgi:Bacterial protein of unknown function (DUF937)
MAVNLVSLAMKFLTPDLMLKIASGLGLDKMLAQKAMGAAVPAILAGLAGKAAKPDGAKSIFDALGRQDSGLLGSIAGMLGGSGQSSLINSGTNALTSMLGGSAVSGLAGAVAKYAGIGETPAKSLLGLLGPVVMGTLGQEQKANKLDAGGIASLLADQKEHIASALPGDFSKLLGATGLLDAIQAPAKSGTSTASTTASTPSRRVETPVRGSTGAIGHVTAPAAPWWRLPLIAAAALGLGWSLFGSNPSPSLTGPAPGAAQRIVVDGVDLGGQMTTVLDGLRTTLGNVRDTGTAQSAIPRLQEAATQLDRVTGLAAKLAPENRKKLAGSVATGLTGLNPLFNSVLAIPGVSALAKPAIDAVRAKLDVLSRG